MLMGDAIMSIPSHLPIQEKLNGVLGSLYGLSDDPVSADEKARLSDWADAGNNIRREDLPDLLDLLNEIGNRVGSSSAAKKEFRTGWEYLRDAKQYVKDSL